MRRFCVLGLWILLLVGVGCTNKPAASSAAQPPGGAGPPTVAPPPAGGVVPPAGAVPPPALAPGLPQVLQRPQVDNDLRQLALFYQTYPGKVREVKSFLSYIQREAPQLAQAVQQGIYVVVPNAPPQTAAIVAYTAQPDPQGRYHVARGDGSVEVLSSAELQTALRQQQGQP
jgi:hypothetical protein